MGERALTKILVGIEAVKGTGVAATDMYLLENPPIPDDKTNEVVADDSGLRGPGVRVRNGDVVGILDTLPFADIYFQALPSLLSCGVVGSVTPTEQTTTEGDYEWDFDPSLSATNDPESMTLERGDDDGVIEHNYVMFEGYRFQWEIPQQKGSARLACEGQYFARQNVDSSYTGAIAIPVVNNINSKLIRFYRDASWANLGNTEKTNLLRGGDIQFFTGVHPKFLGGANKFFDTDGEGDLMFTAAFTFERGTESEAIRALKDTATKSFVRLEVEGPAIGGGVNHKFTMDLAGFWKDVVDLDSNDRGNNITTAVLEGIIDVTASKVYRLAVITNVAAIS
ncbi:MAG: hypothetical protein KAJ07_04765 [Planctomycetes bacterium]|nr:hypothetical protein [Planctomycetota bacterium]